MTTSSTTSSSSTGTGGTGGQSTTCDTLVLTGPPITTGLVYTGAARARLIPVTEDGALVSLVYEGYNAPGGVRLVNTVFQPWGVWPASLEPPHQLLGAVDGQVLVAPSLPGLSVFFRLPSTKAPWYVSFGTAALQTDYDVAPPGPLWDALTPSMEPVALARGATRHLVAYATSDSTSRHLAVAPVDSSTGVGPHKEMACGSGYMNASAVPTTGGFLLAAASGRPFGTCPFNNGSPAPSLELQLSRLDEGAQSAELLATFQEQSQILEVMMTKAAEGSWLVWQSEGSSATRAVRLDASGALAGPVFDANPGFEWPLPGAVAAFGPWLAIAWNNVVAPASQKVRLDLFDQQGNLVATASQLVGPGAIVRPSLALLGSPDTQHLAVAWAEMLNNQGLVRVARFSCPPP